MKYRLGDVVRFSCGSREHFGKIIKVSQTTFLYQMYTIAGFNDFTEDGTYMVMDEDIEQLYLPCYVKASLDGFTNEYTVTFPDGQHAVRDVKHYK